jgi:tetratricopeptide (TPR) repeat protein
MTRNEAMALLELGRAARLDPGPEAGSWAERLGPKRETLGKAVRWFVKAGEIDEAVELAAGVWRLWVRSGDVQGGRDMLAAALEPAKNRTPTRAFALACYADGLLAFRQGRQEESQVRNEAALEAAATVGNAEAEALALVGLSRVAFRAGDYKHVCSLAQRAASLVARAPENEHVMPLHMLAAGTRLDGDYERARAFYLESLDLNRRLKDEHMIAVELHNLGHVEIHRGDIAAARNYFRECTALRSGSSNPYDTAMDHLNRAALTCVEGKATEAAAALESTESILRDAGIVLDPDDRFEVDWIRDRLVSTKQRA